MFGKNGAPFGIAFHIRRKLIKHSPRERKLERLSRDRFGPNSYLKCEVNERLV